MKIFDPHIHMTSRTTDDYEAMARAGIVAIIEPAFWLGQPRTTVGSFVDYFSSLLERERFRASQFGIRHFCTMGLNPKESNNLKLADEAIALLPRYLNKASSPLTRSDSTIRPTRSMNHWRGSSSWRANSTCRC